MFELSLMCPQNRVEPLSDALDALDALSVSVEDADAQTDAEQALAMMSERVGKKVFLLDIELDANSRNKNARLSSWAGIEYAAAHLVAS